MDDVAELHRRLVARDPEVQAWFWRKHHGRLKQLCRSICQNAAEADEIADAALTDFLFDHVDQIRHPEALVAYLRLVATRRAVRAQKRRKELPSANAANRHVAPDDLEEAAQTVFVADRLMDCLARLTPKARSVLRLRHASELTNQRIGELVGGSKQYIGRLLTKSHALLRECLERQEGSA